jgi:hypothetical protein
MDAPYRRTVAEIERQVKEQRERSLASRIFHAKSDRGKIAAWTSDLKRILKIFDVRCLAPPLASLTIGCQTELAIDTNVTVSGTHNIVSDTHNVVSDIHRVVAKQQEASNGQDSPVSNCYAPPVSS